MTRSAKTSLIAIALIMLLLALAGRQRASEPQAKVANTAEPDLPFPRNETGEPIPFPDKADYALLSAAQLPNGNVTSVSRRYSEQSGVTYTYREFQCEKGLLRTLGSGDTRTQAEIKRSPSEKFGKLYNGSSAYLTAELACARFGKKATAPLP